MKQKKLMVAGCRMTEDENRRLEEMAKKTGLQKGTIFRTSVIAILEIFETNGTIKFPLKLKEEHEDQ